MKQLLEQALTAALQRLKAHADLVGLENVDESTFRSFVIAELMKRRATARCQTEWHRFDLLLQCDSVNVLVEFKFYLMRRTFELDGRRGPWKGEAGTQNEAEFWACVDKLHNLKDPAVHQRYLALVYQKAYPLRSMYSFAKSYDALAAGSKFSTVTDVPHCMAETLTCKILEVLPSTSRV
jgi:hypothetical protein